MNYRIVRITNLYVEYLAHYYATFPWIKERPFKEQHDHLANDCFDVVASFVKNLRNMGVEAFDIYSNAHWLQNQWKRENSCDKSGRELIMEQLKSLKPDILWLDDITLIDRAWISYVRDNIPSLKIITGHICAPYSLENIKNFGKLDFLVTCTPCLKKEFEEQGIETYLLYHSFEKSILESIAQDNTFPENDLLFTGSLYTGGGFHKTRIEYVDEMLNAGLPLKIYGNVDSTLRVLSKIAAFYTINAIRKIGGGKLIKHIPFLHHYESYGDTPVRLYSNKMKATIVQPVFGLEQLKLLSKAGICFNLHGEIAKGCAGNLRLFEATGVGACLVTDWKANLPELFEPEKEVVTYKTKEECVDKIKWLLEHPSEMHKISEAGQARTLRDHTMQNRVSMMDGIFKSKI